MRCLRAVSPTTQSPLASCGAQLRLGTWLVREEKRQIQNGPQEKCFFFTLLTVRFCDNKDTSTQTLCTRTDQLQRLVRALQNVRVRTAALEFASYELQPS